ncbi:MAG: hypothetical protein RIF32_05110 [Leptospirales bacterium]|jgi:hypothetical protein
MPYRFSDFVNARVAAAAFFFAAAAYGMARATRLNWVCDDAFISFRYALNLARGEGLVFNVGEYVEGFTNLLWTLALAPFFALDDDIDIVVVSKVLGLFCYALLLLEYFRQARAGDSDADAPAWPAWPLTLPAVAAHHHLHVFATSGLETMLFTLLITGGALRLARRNLSESSAAFAFVLLALACLTRPDGLLIYGLAAIFTTLVDLRETAATGAPTLWNLYSAISFEWVRREMRRHSFFVFAVGGSFVFRFFYYGDLLPNTFYAKSAHDPYVGQGFYYAGLYFAAYWISLPMLAASVLVAWRRADRFALIPLLCCAWIAYVIWVGGDFMFARFLIPITPLLYFAGEVAARSFLRGRLKAAPPPDEYRLTRPYRREYFVWWGAALILLAATGLRYDPFKGRPLPVIRYVGEEYKIYTDDGMRQLRATALATRASMQAVDPVVAFVGAQAALIFYWDISTAIEAQTGLTDRTIARIPLEERGWIGHEKTAPLAYLRERDVAFILRPPPLERRRPNWNVMKIKGLIGEFEIINYRPEAMERLRRDERFEIPGRGNGER